MRKAFTMVELIFVMAIIGIIASVVISKFNSPTVVFEGGTVTEYSGEYIKDRREFQEFQEYKRQQRNQ